MQSMFFIANKQLFRAFEKALYSTFGTKAYWVINFPQYPIQLYIKETRFSINCTIKHFSCHLKSTLKCNLEFNYLTIS